MAGLRQTTARLARYRGNWEKLLAGSAAGQGGRAPQTNTGCLSEVTGFGSNPGNLRMRTFVPEDCPAGAPLVVVLHGCTQNAEAYDLGAGWSTGAERHGFALLFPEQQRANNPNTCFNWFLPGDTERDRGEALSIRQMVEQMVLSHQLDRNRVFVTGLSAGGAMAAVMLATYPDIFAGGAIIAGLPYGAAGNVQEALDAMFQGKSLPAKAWGDRVRSASDHKGPWPRISIWHGGADTTVLPINADELVKQWTDVHGLPVRPTAEGRVNGYPHRVWRDASGEALMEAYSIPGLAHGAPIATGDGDENCGAAGPFILEAGISSSYRIADFWGLLEMKVRRASKRPNPVPDSRSGSSGGMVASGPPSASAVPDQRPAAKTAGQQQASAFDPHKVITKALRSAGLLKR